MKAAVESVNYIKTFFLETRNLSEKSDIVKCTLNKINQSFDSIANDVKYNAKRKNKLLSSYLHSYPYFVKYFNELDESDIDALICGVYMIYGWMPTTLCMNGGVTFNQCDLDDFVKLINLVKAVENTEGARNVLQELGRNNQKKWKWLKKIVNNSETGTSKLLHFINPAFFPIYDTNVANVLNIQKVKYLDYASGFIDFCDEIRGCCKTENISFNCDMDYQVLDMAKQKQINIDNPAHLVLVRALELAIFYSGRN